MLICKYPYLCNLLSLPMRYVIWTIIPVWVVYQIYRVTKSSRVYVYQKHEHYHNTAQNAQKEGEIRIDRQNDTDSRKPNSDKGGEYVEFEEIRDK